MANTIEKFGISRAAVYKNITKLVKDGLIEHDAAKKGRKYNLVSKRHIFSYDIVPGLSESDVWIKDIEKYVPKKQNVYGIWQYGFTEMFNNAIDHSSGKKIRVIIEENPVKTMMAVIDDGIGIFKNIQSKFDLSNEHEAILELSKGKLTTNREQHSGEGIFFTSRMFDIFVIESHNILFSHNKNYEDIVLDKAGVKQHDGTIIMMQLDNDSNRKTTDIFNEFAGDDYGFDKTIIPIELARYGDDNLVSRSQAKRVLNRVTLFKNVIFDFNNVPQIGQAFADEIFRVFHNAHPEITINIVNANEEVTKMIAHAKSVNI